MDIAFVRNELRTKSIYNINLRVTFYARVSSDSDAQHNSLENQTTYYEDLINSVKAWTYVKGYIDDGISGIGTAKRDDFTRMIDDGANQKFDLIITKEISRFARNTLDSILFTRQLLRDGVCVLFQNDGINTLDDDSELRLTIMAAVAQDEIRKLSTRVKFGHQQAIKKGVVLGNGRMFGFDKIPEKKGVLTVNEEESIMVKKLFELYASGNYSMLALEKLFYEEGYRNHNGGAINHSTMSKIIRNPKYKGYYVGNKVRIIDMFTKKQKFLKESEWVMYKDETGMKVPTIVSEEVWQQANDVLEKRSNDVISRQNKYNHGNLLTGKMYCTHCGTLYHRKMSVDKKGNKNSRWACSNKLTKGSDHCPSFYIFESEIKPILLEAFSEASMDFDKALEKYIKMFEEKMINSNVAKEIDSLKKEEKSIDQRKQKLLSYNVDGKITDADFIKMNSALGEEIKQIEKKIVVLEQSYQAKDNIENKIKQIRQIMGDAKRHVSADAITPDFVDTYIERIDVTPEDGYMMLEIVLKTSQIARKTIVRTGNTFKKMAPVQTIVSGSPEISIFTGAATIERTSVFGHTCQVNYRYRLLG